MDILETNPFADMDKRAWELLTENPSSQLGELVKQMESEFGLERVEAHKEFCRKRSQEMEARV